MSGSFIGESNIEQVVAVIIEIGHRIDTDTWTQDVTYTNCWWITHGEGKPVKVDENGEEYTERASLSLCNSNPRSWYLDDSNNRLYVHTSGSDNPGGDSYIILSYLYERLASHEIVLDGHPYGGYLDRSSVPSITLQTGEYYEGGTQESFGTLRFGNADGYFDTRLDTYIYEAKRIWLYLGKYGAAWSDYVLYWTGWTGNVSWSDLWIEVDIEDLRTCIL